MIQEIKTRLSVFLCHLPREYTLASVPGTASVSHLLQVLHFWPFLSLVGNPGVASFFSALVCLTTDYWIWHLASYADQTEAQTGSTVSPPEKWNSFSGRVNLFKKSFYCDLKANIKLPAGKRDKYAIRSVTSGANVCAQPCYISYCLENQMNQVLLYTGRTESMKLIYTVCFPAGANAVAETVLG